MVSVGLAPTSHVSDLGSDAFYPLNASEVSDAIVSLSGTVQSSLLVENIDLQHDLVKQINDQSRSAHNIFSASVSRNYWQIGSGSFGEHESDAKGFGHDFNRYMALGGIDFKINQNVTLGAYNNSMNFFFSFAYYEDNFDLLNNPYIVVKIYEGTLDGFWSLESKYELEECSQEYLDTILDRRY